MTVKCANRQLLLRPIQLKDTANLRDILLDDTVKLTYMVPDLTKETAQKMAVHIAELSKANDRYVRGIYRNETLIGLLNDVESGQATIELGWVIAPAHQGNGYATEAVCVAIDDLFSKGYTQVIAGAFAENAASIRVMEKAGMVLQEKTETIEYRNKAHQCVYYAKNKH